MLFYLTKIIHFFINPLLWIVVIQIVALLLNNPKKKKKLLLISFLFLYVFSNGFILGKLIKNWEWDIKPIHEISQKYDYGIVPGGFSDYFPENERIQFNRANDRLMQALHLYKKGVIEKIIISGGSGKILTPDEKESNSVRQYLLDIGIPPSDLLIENQSRNTYENAKNVADLYNSDTSTFALVTSAIHMKRALGCFKKQGLNIEPYAVDFIIPPEKERGDVLRSFIPSAGTLTGWHPLFREWIGYLGYKVKGYL